MDSLILSIPAPIFLLMIFIAFMVIIGTIASFLIHKTSTSEMDPMKPDKGIRHTRTIRSQIRRIVTFYQEAIRKFLRY